MKKRLLAMALSLSLAGFSCISGLGTASASETAAEQAVVTTAESSNMHFSVQEGDYIEVLAGEGNGLYIAGYYDGIEYDDGETPFVFEIEDESVAEIIYVKGNDLCVRGLRLGETVLTATAPDGQTASLKIIVSGDPSVTTTTAVWTTEPTTTTTVTTAAEPEMITDADIIREMLTSYIEENGFDARITTNEEYPGYQPVIFEYNTAETVNGTALNILLREYAAENNIDLSQVGFIPIVNGVAITTSPADVPVTAATVTTAVTTTTTAADTTEAVPTTTVPETTETTPAVTDVPIIVADLRFNIEEGEYADHVGILAGIELLGAADDEDIVYTLSDESLGKITYSDNTQVVVELLAEGELVLTAAAPDGREVSMMITVLPTETEPTPLDPEEELPQTGYSNGYKVLIGLASAMTLAGAAMVIFSRKKDDE